MSFIIKIKAINRKITFIYAEKVKESEFTKMEKAKELVSVIVPVYNVEKYVDECIRSICMQTYPYIEIIIVDDGSTDGSGKKCNIWAEKDNRIQVIHKKNGGLSDARNHGLARAKGEWLLFVDSDDYITYDLIEKILNTVKKFSYDKIDIVFYGYTEFGENDEIDKDIEAGEQPFVKTSKEVIKDIVYGIEPVMVCTKLYRAKIWVNLRFPIGRIHEDDYVILPTLETARDICIMREKMYFYRRRKSSLSNSVNEKEIRDRLDVYKERVEYIKGDDELFVQAVYHYLCTFINVYFECMCKEKEVYLKEYRMAYKKYKKYVNKRKLIILRLFYLCPYIYGLLIKLKKGNIANNKIL